MNNPFQYSPSEAMLCAQRQLVAHINRLRNRDAEFREETDRGKMFGILLTDNQTLWAFSGQICGRYGIEGFVLAVFDYLAPDGYFKTKEAEIIKLNHLVAQLENSDEYKSLLAECKSLEAAADKEISDYQAIMKRARADRDSLRREGVADKDALVRESQYQKAELHRKKLFWREKLSMKSSEIDEIEGSLRKLKLQRQRQSDALQQWLFNQFVFQNINGERRSLTEIFTSFSLMKKMRMNIPSGAGECCEPKLLQQAFLLGLQPVEIGMFWWGASPAGEVRHHLQFYPACNGKCRPVLSFMLGEDLCFRNNREFAISDGFIVYEDSQIFVVNKPAGLLSVPGKTDDESVLSILHRLRPDCSELLPVHRLDMDTSGLLLIAKNADAHRTLQSQFASHEIKKEYVAQLERPCEATNLPKESGEIRLPLRPDFNDRPRQIVHFEHGRAAVTEYQFIAPNRVLLRPQTGRTHQLRLHCAHHQGLNNPIFGDSLYGRNHQSAALRLADNNFPRLHLHASKITFTHPLTKESLTFTSPIPF